MAVRRIVKVPAPILKQKAKKIHRFDESMRRLAEDLVDTMFDANGAGLAAPQIGVPLRAIVVRRDQDLPFVIVNPEIVELGEEEEEADEACLSIPGFYGPVVRKLEVTVRGLTRTGKPTKIKSEGWEARIFQHEVDHLNGILYTDHIEDKSRIQPVRSEEEEEELEQEHALA